jgi:uncharacterized protein YndB with AHSA1/START domain
MEPKKDLTFERTLNAPRETVWKAWTDPKLVAQWWGPNGVTNPVCEVDPRVGGVLHIVMEAGEEMGPAKGMKWPMKGTFTEVVAPERLVFKSQAFSSPDEKEAAIETTTEVTLLEDGNKTKMKVHTFVTKTTPGTNGFPSADQAIAGMEAGWSQQFDKLGKFLAQ